MTDKNADRISVPRVLIERVANIAETLANLNYLIEVEADNADAVRRYAKYSSDTVKELGNILFDL